MQDADLGHLVCRNSFGNCGLHGLCHTALYFLSSTLLVRLQSQASEAPSKDVARLVYALLSVFTFLFAI
jgi:hypothetical protein